MCGRNWWNIKSHYGSPTALRLTESQAPEHHGWVLNRNNWVLFPFCATDHFNLLFTETPRQSKTKHDEQVKFIFSLGLLKDLVEITLKLLSDIWQGRTDTTKAKRFQLSLLVWEASLIRLTSYERLFLQAVCKAGGGLLSWRGPPRSALWMKILDALAQLFTWQKKHHATVDHFCWRQ